MFSFFTKKNFLVDHLDGFIDIHNHILPAIDDGAKTVEESIDLIKGFGEFGIKDFICTPHIMHNYYDNTPNTVKESYKKIKKALKENSIENIKIDYAAEHMIDDNFENILEDKKILPLNSNHLLIEMSFLQPPVNFDIATEKIMSSRFFPILAHPERYLFLHESLGKYEAYKKDGVLFQMNLLSIAGYYGKDVKAISKYLLEKNLIDYMGSDVHTQKQLSFIKNTAVSSKLGQRIEPIIKKTIQTFCNK